MTELTVDFLINVMMVIVMDITPDTALDVPLKERLKLRTRPRIKLRMNLRIITGSGSLTHDHSSGEKASLMRSRLRSLAPSRSRHQSSATRRFAHPKPRSITFQFLLFDDDELPLCFDAPTSGWEIA